MDNKIALLQQKLGENEMALIVSGENRFYFTSFNTSNGYLLVGSKFAYFITDSRYIEASQKIINNCEVLLENNIFEQIKSLANKNNSSIILIESSRLSYKKAMDMKDKFDGINVDLSDKLDGMIDGLRIIKSQYEVDCIKKAQAIAEDAFEHLLKMIKVGVSEKSLALELDYLMLKNGAEALSFETIAVSGANSSMPHGVPSDKKVEDGDFITFDFGAVYKGYHSDMTRTVAVGRVSDEQKKVYDTVLKAQLLAIEVIKNGVECAKADLAARDFIKENGYGEYYNHSTGHGVGVEIHESPTLYFKNQTKLQTGMVVTVEPGIYIPQKFGVRIEDMVWVTHSSCENLTKTTKELIIL